VTSVKSDGTFSKKMSPRILKLAGWSVAVIVCIGLPIVSLFSYPSDLLFDDPAIALKYVENLAAGHGYRYNASDPEPVFGSSSFLFTCLAAGLKRLAVFDNNFLYMRLPGLFAYAILLFIAFRTGRQSGGAIGGLLSLAYFTSFPGYFENAAAGLEAVLAAALVATAIYLFYFNRADTVLYAICALLVMTKIDLLPIASVLVVARVYLNLKRSARSEGPWDLAKPLLAYVIPTLTFFLVCWAYFGSPIPNSLTAKMVFSKSQDGLKYLRAFFDFGWGYGTAWLFVAGLAPIAILASVLVSQRKSPSPQFLVVSFCCALLLAQVLFCPFLEVWSYYFVVPVTGFQMLVAIAASEYAGIGLNRTTRARAFLIPTAVLALMAAFTPVFSDAGFFFNQLKWANRLLTEVEGERKALGEFIRSSGHSNQTVLVGHGWPAYSSGMKAIDFTGINTPWVMSIKDRSWGERMTLCINKYSPDFIISHKQVMPMLLNQYELVRLGFNVALWGYGEWEVYRRRDSPLGYGRVKFLPLKNCHIHMVDEGFGPKVFPRTPFDIRVHPSSPGVEETYVEFTGLKASRGVVGVYCYVDNPKSKAVDFVLEARIVGGQALTKVVSIGPKDGIRLVTLDLPEGPTDFTLKISTRMNRGADASYAWADIRDLFIAERPSKR
jgi:hypothetical protein